MAVPVEKTGGAKAGGAPSGECGACGDAGSSEASMPAVADVTIADSVACLCGTFGSAGRSQELRMLFTDPPSPNVIILFMWLGVNCHSCTC